MNRMVCRTMLCLFAMAGASASVCADEKEEWKKLNGKWKIEKAVFMGNDSTEVFRAAVLIIADGKYSVVFGETEDKGALELNASKKPKQMTIKSTDGPNKGKTFPAIYEIDGDTCKICYSIEGKEPPKEFESKEGTMTLYIVYKRDKK